MRNLIIAFLILFSFTCSAQIRTDQAGNATARKNFTVLDSLEVQSPVREVVFDSIYGYDPTTGKFALSHKDDLGISGIDTDSLIVQSNISPERIVNYWIGTEAERDAILSGDANALDDMIVFCTDCESGGSGTDSDAIHDNVAGEISAITEKTTPVSADLIIIEDSEDSNNKKSVEIGNLPGSVTVVDGFSSSSTTNAGSANNDRLLELRDDNIQMQFNSANVSISSYNNSTFGSVTFGTDDIIVMNNYNSVANDDYIVLKKTSLNPYIQELVLNTNNHIRMSCSTGSNADLGNELFSLAFLTNPVELAGLDSDYACFPKTDLLNSTISGISNYAATAYFNLVMVDTENLPIQTSGTFTPTLVDAGSGATYSITVDNASYVVSGNIATLSIRLSGINTTGTPTGNLRITGLPSVIYTSSSYGASCSVDVFNGSDVSFYSVSGNVSSSGIVSFVGVVSQGITASFDSVTLTSGTIHLTATYEID